MNSDRIFYFAKIQQFWQLSIIFNEIVTTALIEEIEEFLVDSFHS